MTPERYKYLTEGGLIPLDKNLHLSLGFLFTAYFAFAISFIPGIQKWHIVIACVVFAALFGIGKEIFDKRKKGVFDIYDAIFTFVGGVLYLPMVIF